MKGILNRIRDAIAPIETLAWPDVKADLVTRIAPLVAPWGLEHQRGLDFVGADANADGMRRLFRIHDAGWGRPLTANWGYCLDFVPHLAAQQVHRHRTFKSARADFWMLCRDGVQPNPALGRRAYDRDLPELLAFGLEQATVLWREKHGLEDLLGLIESAAAHDWWRTGAVPQGRDGFVSLKSDFAEPFTLARCGQLDAALRKLDFAASALDLSQELKGALRNRLLESARPVAVPGGQAGL